MEFIDRLVWNFFMRDVYVFKLLIFIGLFGDDGWEFCGVLVRVDCGLGKGFKLRNVFFSSLRFWNGCLVMRFERIFIFWSFIERFILEKGGGVFWGRGLLGGGDCLEGKCLEGWVSGWF